MLLRNRAGCLVGQCAAVVIDATPRLERSPDGPDSVARSDDRTDVACVSVAVRYLGGTRVDGDASGVAVER